KSSIFVIERIFFAAKSASIKELTEEIPTISNSLTLPDEILEKSISDPVFDKIKDLYKSYPKNEREIKAAMLLYMLVKPQAFIFEEKAIKVNEDFDRGSIVETNSKNKKYLANRVNDQTFFDFLIDRLGL
ncbi:MAG: hypothetical protein E6046_32535, partial [Pseudomonas aeruginosa]|nr:hypothetical protein [Pseudomonas aeruginosa]